MAPVLALTFRYQVITLVALTGLCGWLWPVGLGGLLAGGILMTANFWALGFFAKKALGGAKPKLAYGLAAVLKLAVVLGLLTVCITVLGLNALGIALGLGTLFVGLGIASLHLAFGPPRPAQAPH